MCDRLIEMLFKSLEIATQFKELPAKLQAVVILFGRLANHTGHQATVTRCWEPVTGDSGVHEAHRGVDCRDQTDQGREFNDDEAKRIIDAINAFYPRTDGKPVAMHHSFGGGPLHFHFQIPETWV